MTNREIYSRILLKIDSANDKMFVLKGTLVWCLMRMSESDALDVLENVIDVVDNESERVSAYKDFKGRAGGLMAALKAAADEMYKKGNS